MDSIPKDAQVYFEGAYLKIGVRDMPFIWNGEEWVRSHKTVNEVRLAIKDQGDPNGLKPGHIISTKPWQTMK